MLNFLKQNLVKWGFTCSVKVHALFQMSAFSKLNSLSFRAIFHHPLSTQWGQTRCPHDAVESTCSLLKGKGLGEPWWKLISYLSAFYLFASWPSAKKWKLKPLSSYSIALKRHQWALQGTRDVSETKVEGLTMFFISVLPFGILWAEGFFPLRGQEWPSCSQAAAAPSLETQFLPRLQQHLSSWDLEWKGTKLWNKYQRSCPDRSLFAIKAHPEMFCQRSAWWWRGQQLIGTERSILFHWVLLGT